MSSTHWSAQFPISVYHNLYYVPLRIGRDVGKTATMSYAAFMTVPMVTLKLAIKKLANYPFLAWKVRIWFVWYLLLTRRV